MDDPFESGVNQNPNETVGRPPDISSNNNIDIPGGLGIAAEARPSIPPYGTINFQTHPLNGMPLYGSSIQAEARPSGSSNGIRAVDMESQNDLLRRYHLASNGDYLGDDTTNGTSNKEVVYGPLTEEETLKAAEEEPEIITELAIDRAILGTRVVDILNYPSYYDKPDALADIDISTDVLILSEEERALAYPQVRSRASSKEVDNNNQQPPTTSEVVSLEEEKLEDLELYNQFVEDDEGLEGEDDMEDEEGEEDEYDEDGVEGEGAEDDEEEVEGEEGVEVEDDDEDIDVEDDEEDIEGEESEDDEEDVEDEEDQEVIEIEEGEESEDGIVYEYDDEDIEGEESEEDDENESQDEVIELGSQSGFDSDSSSIASGSSGASIDYTSRISPTVRKMMLDMETHEWLGSSEESDSDDDSDESGSEEETENESNNDEEEKMSVTEGDNDGDEESDEEEEVEIPVTDNGVPLTKKVQLCGDILKSVISNLGKGYAFQASSSAKPNNLTKFMLAGQESMEALLDIIAECSIVEMTKKHVILKTLDKERIYLNKELFDLYPVQENLCENLIKMELHCYNENFKSFWEFIREYIEVLDIYDVQLWDTKCLDAIRSLENVETVVLNIGHKCMPFFQKVKLPCQTLIMKTLTLDQLENENFDSLSQNKVNSLTIYGHYNNVGISKMNLQKLLKKIDAGFDGLRDITIFIEDEGNVNNLDPEIILDGLFEVEMKYEDIIITLEFTFKTQESSWRKTALYKKLKESKDRKKYLSRDYVHFAFDMDTDDGAGLEPNRCVKFNLLTSPNDEVLQEVPTPLPSPVPPPPASSDYSTSASESTSGSEASSSEGSSSVASSSSGSPSPPSPKRPKMDIS